jgi:hypothetical protein
VLQLLLAANVVSSLLIIFTLKMKAIRFPETSVLAIAAWRQIPEDDILHGHCRENLKPYIALSGWTL